MKLRISRVSGKEINYPNIKKKVITHHHKEYKKDCVHWTGDSRIDGKNYFGERVLLILNSDFNYNVQLSKDEDFIEYDIDETSYIVEVNSLEELLKLAEIADTKSVGGGLIIRTWKSGHYSLQIYDGYVE